MWEGVQGGVRVKTVTMNGTINAEMQHEIDCVETAIKWREWCKKARKEGIIDSK